MKNQTGEALRDPFEQYAPLHAEPLELTEEEFARRYLTPMFEHARAEFLRKYGYSPTVEKAE